MLSHKLSKPTLISSNSDQAIGAARKEADLISKLPDELIHTILSHLVLRDAVKTSVLSHRWKCVYSSLSQLRFEWITIKPEVWDSCKKPCVLYKEKFVGAVNQFLRFYQGTQLSLFTVKCCLGQEWKNDIDGWVRFALGHGTQTLTLHLNCDKLCLFDDKQRYGRDFEGNYVLERELSEGMGTYNLKNLKLVACTLGKNFIYQFRCLESLVLCCSPLSLYDIDSLFSCLSKLKILKLVNCTLPTKLCLNLLPLLERFAVAFINGLKEIEFLNVNLVRFECLCSGKMILFDLRGAPNLKHLTYHASTLELANVFTNLSAQLPKLSSLRLWTHRDWVQFMPKTISTFSQVTSMEMVFIDCEFSALNIISFLRAFPHLCKLSLETDCEEDFDEEMGDGQCEYVPNYLREVEIIGSQNSQKQTKFVSYLLKNASALERLVVKFLRRDQRERREITELVRQVIKDGALLVFQ